MDEATFESQAEMLLARLFDEIDGALGDVLDVDLQGGILEIVVPQGGGTYVINKHAVNREIWMSSPSSGAWHFRPEINGSWLSTRGGKNAPSLTRLLSDELAAVSHRSFSIKD